MSGCPMEPEPTPLAEIAGLTRIAMFAALVGAGAFIYIPFGPMFLSLQTMMVMLTGFMLGPRRAVVAMSAYLACGFIGLPVFGRGRAGPASFLGPTAGYFPGFVLGAALAGCSVYFVGSRRRRVIGMIVCGLAGTAALLFLGAVGLRLLLIDDWGRAFAVGFFPFLPGDCVKMVAAAAVKEAFFPERGAS